MLKIIRQRVVFPEKARRLYDMYMNPRIHGDITGGPVIISSKPGSRFSAFDGSVTGRTLQVVPGRLIVQSWRSDNFKPDDIDSTLILNFLPDPKGGRIDLIHVNVAEQDHDGVVEGWKEFYWKPWKEYLKKS